MTEAAAPVAAPSNPGTGGGNPGQGGAPPAAPPPGGPTGPGVPAAPPAGGASEAQKAAARVELHKLPPDTIVVMPVNGRDVEMTAAQALKQLGRGASANQKFEQASQLRRETQELAHEIAANLGNPHALRQLLTQAGMSPREIAQAMLHAEEQEANLTPEQKRMREYEQRIEQMHAEAQQREQREYEAQRTQYAQTYAREFGDAMTRAGVPAEAQGVRALLMPQLARAAAQIQQLEGRSMTRREATEVAREMLSQIQGVRAPETDDDRRRRITAEDVAWFQQQQAAQRRAPMPQVPRDQQGRFTAEPQAARPEPRDVNGKRIVTNMEDAYQRR